MEEDDGAVKVRVDAFVDEFDPYFFQFVLLNNAKNSEVDEDDDELELPSSSFLC